jgi:homotetrameric cytidine deaminase
MAEDQLQKAFAAAAAARANAHAPYSRFKVGAALLLESGEVVAGCNVENSSFGGTICAERNAICACVARFGGVKARALVLVTDPEASPCGLCLQVISEFCPGSLPIHLSTPAGLGAPRLLKEFLPLPFSADQLK